MRGWLQANGGPIALVVLGIGIGGFTNALIGVGLIVAGVAVLIVQWSRHRHAPPGEAGPAVSARQAPRPDIRIFDLRPTGGASDYVGFAFKVANYGTQRCRCRIEAHVGDQLVECQPAEAELLPDAPQAIVQVFVPRPGLGYLVPEFNGETTLYGAELRISVQATTADAKTKASWREHVYTEEENAQRHAIQRRTWRLGLGEATEADLRADAISDLMRRHESRVERGQPPPHELI